MVVVDKPPGLLAEKPPHRDAPNLHMLAETQFGPCLLYTSDAADERSSVDLGGRRIIKKKKYHHRGKRYNTLNKLKHQYQIIRWLKIQTTY